MTSSKTINVSLIKNTFTFTINPTPSDATVKLTATGYTQSGNSITVYRGTTVSWVVSKSGYKTQSGTVSISEDKSLNITLEANVRYIASRSLTDYYTSDDGINWSERKTWPIIPRYGNNIILSIPKNNISSNILLSDIGSSRWENNIFYSTSDLQNYITYSPSIGKMPLGIWESIQIDNNYIVSSYTSLHMLNPTTKKISSYTVTTNGNIIDIAFFNGNIYYACEKYNDGYTETVNIYRCSPTNISQTSLVLSKTFTVPNEWCSAAYFGTPSCLYIVKDCLILYTGSSKPSPYTKNGTDWLEITLPHGDFTAEVRGIKQMDNTVFIYYQIPYGQIYKTYYCYTNDILSGNFSTPVLTETNRDGVIFGPNTIIRNTESNYYISHDGKSFSGPYNIPTDMLYVLAY